MSGLEPRSDSEDENGLSTLEDQVHEVMRQVPLQSHSSPLSDSANAPLDQTVTDKNEEKIQRKLF